MAKSPQHEDPNPRLTENTCDEPEASLMPLEDYQHLQLVPLEIAAEPIRSIFRNLPRDVWIAKNASKQPADGLTSDESAAIHLYTMEVKDQTLYSLLNKLLRDRDRRKLKPWFSYLKLFLTALFKLPSCSAKTVWRGVKADLHLKYHRGEHYTWWAFTSCTRSVEVLQQKIYLGETGDRTLFSIECLNGKNIRPHSYYKREDEILLLPGFYFEVVSKVNVGNGLHIIHLHEVTPPFVLLEPPFDIHQSTSIPPIAPTIDKILEKVYEMNKNNDNVFKLFVVLPNPLVKWNSINLFNNHYVLHVVCECSINDWHFDCHPPYSVPNPRIFFQIYGDYMKQFMISLAQHLFGHQIIDRYHDTHFWSIFTSDLEKMVRVLGAVQHESSTLTKANDTSELLELIMYDWPQSGSLCRSLNAEMSVRWVCMKHYPTDQLNLIRELENIKEVNYEKMSNGMEFTDDMDSAKISRVCSILERGLRLFQINLSSLKLPESSLKQMTGTLSRASIMDVYFDYYLFNEPTNSEKLEIEGVQRSCNTMIALNSHIKHATMIIDDKYLQRNFEVVDALRSNRTLRSLTYGWLMTKEDFNQIMLMIATNQALTTLEFANHLLPLDGEKVIASFIRSSRTLTNLSLYSTKIKDEGMALIVDAVCTSPTMKKLNVWGNNLSDESAVPIARLVRLCPSLTSLNVSLNKLTVIGARLVFEELHINQTLLCFGISNNDLSVDHARKTTTYTGPIIDIGQLIAEMLITNKTLCILDIADTNLSDNDLRPLADALTKNDTLTHIRLKSDKYNSILHRPITDALHLNNNLISLDLTFSNLENADIEKLSEMLQNKDKLRFLNLYWCKIGDHGTSILARALRNNRTLTHLNLANNKLTSASADVLADVLRGKTNLIHLDVNDNEIGDNAVKAIALALLDNCTLTYFNIQTNQITDNGAQALAHALKSNCTLLHLEIKDGNHLSSSIFTILLSTRSDLFIT